MGVPSFFFVFWLLAWLLTVSYKDRDGMGVPSFFFIYFYFILFYFIFFLLAWLMIVSYVR